MTEWFRVRILICVSSFDNIESILNGYRAGQRNSGYWYWYWLQSWLEKQWILILLRRGDITSAIAAIKNCDIRKQKYRTLQKQGNIEVCKKRKTTKLCKNTKTQEYQYRNSLCSGCHLCKRLVLKYFDFSANKCNLRCDYRSTLTEKKEFCVRYTYLHSKVGGFGHH